MRCSLVTGSAILALFLAGYLGQQYLPPPKPRVIGLDLGTTFCSVGVFHPGSGEVEVIADEEGRLSIPSCVSFTAAAVLVGHEAAEQSERNPRNTIYDAKRFIGKIFEPGVLEQESARYPFKVGHPETGLEGNTFHPASLCVCVCVPGSNQSTITILLRLDCVINTFIMADFGVICTKMRSITNLMEAFAHLAKKNIQPVNLNSGFIFKCPITTLLPGDQQQRKRRVPCLH